MQKIKLHGIHALNIVNDDSIQFLLQFLQKIRLAKIDVISQSTTATVNYFRLSRIRLLAVTLIQIKLSIFLEAYRVEIKQEGQ